MKQSHIVLALLALFAGLKGQAQAYTNPAMVDLQTSGNYTIMANTIISTTGVTSITGDIGTRAVATSLSTFGATMDGSGQFSTSTYVVTPGKLFAYDYTNPTPSEMNQASIDMGAAYTDASGRPFGPYTEGVDGQTGLGAGTVAGGTLARGIYIWTSNVDITDDLTLAGSATDVWIFVMSGNLVIADSKKIILSGGALASNVFWAVAGTTSLNASTVFYGNILGQLTINMISGAVLNGRALGKFDVTLIANTINPLGGMSGLTQTETPTPTSSPTDTPTVTVSPTMTGTPTDSPTTSATPTVTPSASITRTSTSTPTATTISTPASEVNLGTAGYYGVLASTFSLAGGITTIAGDAGFTTLAGPGTHTLTGTNRMPPPAKAGEDQNAALAALNSMACTYTFAAGAIDLAADETHGTKGFYTPGVYCVDGAMSIEGGVLGVVTLNGKGTYVFRSTGAFDTSNNSSVLLIGGADACDVFWIPGAATTLGANTLFKGTIIDNAGITVGTTVTWQGRALAYGGTITMTADSIVALSCDAVAAGVYTGPNAPTSGKSFVFPSPARGDTVNVVYTMLESGKAEIRIYNENGDLVTRTEETRSAGPQRKSIPINSFAPGIYLYKIILSYDSGNVDRMNVQKFAVIK